MTKFGIVFSVIIACLFTACSLFRATTKDGITEVVEMTLIPDMTPTRYSQWEKPKVLVRILADGSVYGAKILNPSGSSEWDAATIDSLKKWRFSRLPPDTPPEGMIFHIVLDIEPLDDFVIYTIGELWTTGKDEADLLFVELKEGADFFELAHRLQDSLTDETAFNLRSTDLSNYPEHVRKVVRKLRYNEFSIPVKVGDQYVIYKRFRESFVYQ